MPLYSIECPFCGFIEEHLQEPSEAHVDVACPACGTMTNRHENRAWGRENIGIQGDTCSGCVDYTGYDEGLGVVTHGKKHRDAVMKEKGLTEWQPSELYKESKYVRDHSAPGDPAAIKARRELGKVADKKVRRKHVKEVISKAKKRITESL